MGADNQEPGAYDVDDGNEGYKTGTSTPGYRQEGGRFFVPVHLPLLDNTLVFQYPASFW